MEGRAAEQLASHVTYAPLLRAGLPAAGYGLCTLRAAVQLGAGTAIVLDLLLTY
jgi:hypothetical protein